MCEGLGFRNIYGKWLDSIKNWVEMDFDCQNKRNSQYPLNYNKKDREILNISLIWKCISAKMQCTFT